jgi:hypothetical protein
MIEPEMKAMHHSVFSETRGQLTRRSSGRKYVFTERLDQAIREIYLQNARSRMRPGVRQLASQIGIPHWAIKKRARELGLTRTKEKSWSEPELAILARYAWMSKERIRLKLKSAGYARTVTGIHLKLKRMRFRSDPSFYSAKGLADALGIDSHVVTRWIKAGHLRAELRGTKRTELQGGDPSAKKTCDASFSNTPPKLICAKSISCGSWT